MEKNHFSAIFPLQKSLKRVSGPRTVYSMNMSKASSKIVLSHGKEKPMGILLFLEKIRGRNVD